MTLILKSQFIISYLNSFKIVRYNLSDKLKGNAKFINFSNNIGIRIRTRNKLFSVFYVLKEHMRKKFITKIRDTKEISFLVLHSAR